jgi:hypothetical protein
MSLFKKLKEMNKPRFYVVGYYSQDKKTGERTTHKTPVLDSTQKEAFFCGAAMLEMEPFISLEGTKGQIEQLLELTLKG